MRRLEANGTTIAYARTGAGPPIVRMRGVEADPSTFARLSTELASRCTVIVCDQRAGDTGNPGQPDTLEDLCIAQLLAVHHPERTDRVKNPKQIARMLYPELHLAAHSDVSELLKSSAGPSNNNNDARCCSGRHLHSICLGSRRRRWCSRVTRTAWFRAPTHCRLPKEKSGAQVSILEGVGYVNAISAPADGAP